jgi:tetratricopeptide (TPR) repeat protein
VTPLPPAPPAEVAPDLRARIAAADRPEKDAAVSTGGSRGAAGHAKTGARAHAAQRAHHQKKKHTARPARSKHTRMVAHESAAAPKAADDERSARASYERGNQRLLTGDTAAAISAYEEAVRSAPSSPSGYRGLGLAYEKEGKIAEAVRAFRHYLKLAPSSGDRDLVARRLRHLLRPAADPGK